LSEWHDLYVKNASVYQPILEAGLSSAPSEAKGLAKIFEANGLRLKGASKPRILDVSCGIGRHSVQLAKLGYEVVGFDFSPYFLRTARRLAKAEGLGKESVRFVEGDTKEIRRMLEGRGEAGFDAIICMDTSIVRKSLKEEVDLLHSLHELAREGALLVIETANRDNFLKHQPYLRLPIIQSFPEARLQRHLQASYDAERGFIVGEWRFYREQTNKDLKHLLSINIESNIHSRKDLREALESAGWKYVRSYGSVQRLDRLTSDSYHIVMVARKAS
jgi:SAM-dependent methyltransferase